MSNKLWYHVKQKDNTFLTFFNEGDRQNLNSFLTDKDRWNLDSCRTNSDTMLNNQCF